MRLPSVDFLYTSAQKSLKRFPFSLISSLIAVGLAVYLVEAKEKFEDDFSLVNLMLVAALGIPFYFCVSILKEKLNFTKIQYGLSLFVVSVLLGCIYISLPLDDDMQSVRIPYIRYAVFNVVAHLLVSFVPYYSGEKLNGFWNYNKTLFIRIVTSFLYSSVFSVGIILALVVIRNLFSIHFDESIYGDIAIVIFGFFNTWFFVAGIPADLEKLEEVYEYPKGLKVFVQYVLLPLLVVYLLILYTYGVKIIGLWDWPKGIVSYLVSVVSILGIFTFLLMHPYSTQKKNAWIAKFSKAYYYVLIPLVILLFIAVIMRINDYGITVNRYVILVLGIWLAIISLYFILGRNNIKFIPISLAVLMLLASFGPWSMFSMGEQSQVDRLKQILVSTKILENKKVVNEPFWKSDSEENFKVQNSNKNSEKVSDSMYKEISSILNYLEDYHGFSKINSWYTNDIDSLVMQQRKLKKYVNVSKLYLRSLGLEGYRYSNDNYKSISYAIGNDKRQKNIYKIKDYDYLIQLEFFYSEDLVVTREVSKSNLVIDRSLTKKAFIATPKDTLYFDFAYLKEQLAKKYKQNLGNVENVKPEDLILQTSSENSKAKLFIDEIRFEASSKKNTSDKSEQLEMLLAKLFLKE